MIYTSPWGERVFAQIQPDLLTINNNGGTWNSAGAQYIRVTEDSLHIQADEPKVATNVKHGTTSQLARITGRKSATWSLNAPIAPSGVQAVAPDIDPLLQGAFGGPGAVVTGTPFGNAWEYSPKDQLSKPLTILGFQHGQAATGNRYVMGALPTQFSIDFNGNILGMSLNGVGVSALENEAFAALPDAVPYGGLGSFPGEPGSISFNGPIVNAFGGQLFVDTQLFSNQCDNLQLRHNTGLGLKGNFVDSAYGVAVTYNTRSSTLTIGFVNNDSSAIALLKTYGRNNSVHSVSFYLGTIAGQRMYIKVNGVQFTPGVVADQNGYVTLTFNEATSSVAAGFSNDLQLGFA